MKLLKGKKEDNKGIEEQVMEEAPKEEKGENEFMLKVAAFIVDKRNLFFLIFVLAIIFSLVASSWVSVENSLAKYLPETAETTRALDIMEEQFTTYGTAKLVVENITYSQAEAIKEDLENLDYISMVQFDNTKEHYNNFAALYNMTFPYSETDNRALEAVDKLSAYMEGHDYYISTEMGDQASETINEEMKVITVCVAVIVLAVLIFTSDSFAEVPVLIMTFLSSAALASGTNFLLGTISFVSDSVTIVLQLALSVDYAVIFLNRYKEEHKTLDVRDADVVALSKAIPEITASSLTTIGGLIAMGFMQFGIGPDMAIVLIKAILLSLLAVFLLMPGLIMLFANLMEKTKHKSFVPEIPFVGKFAFGSYKIVPLIFLVVIVIAFNFAKGTPYVYGYSQIETPKQSTKTQIDHMISETFGDPNYVALVVPGSDYDKEAQLIADLEKHSEIKSITALASTEALDGVMLTEKLNSRELAELVGIDKEVADVLYTAYAVDKEFYGRIVGGISDFKVPLIDMLIFIHQELEEGYVTLDDDMTDTINTAYNQIMIARNQLQGPDYDRMLIYLNLPQEGDETFAFLDEMHTISAKYYGADANILVAGNSTSQYDLYKTFQRDNMVVTVVSMLAVLVVLLFTFKSAGMPVLLIAVIEGCIWMNFSYPTLTHTNIFFMGYLIVSSIQMGANIDYAIVVSSRYQEVKKIMPKKDAIIDTMNFAFPTIITSGTMMVMAGYLIGQLTSEACICGIGQCLFRGTLISIITVLFVLPQILLLGDRIIDKTSFDVNLSMPVQTQSLSGVTRVDGIISGRVNGRMVGTFRGVIYGDVDAKVTAGKMEALEASEEEEANDEE